MKDIIKILKISIKIKPFYKKLKKKKINFKLIIKTLKNY